MKKVLFAAPFLAISLFFTFCSKTNVQEEIPSTELNIPASDRATCYLQIWGHTYNVVVCGTGTNSQTCAHCGTSTGPQGSVVYSPTLVYTKVEAPAKISVTSTAPIGEFITLTTASNQIGPVFLPAGGCLSFTIDMNCTIQ